MSFTYETLIVTGIISLIFIYWTNRLSYWRGYTKAGDLYTGVLVARENQIKKLKLKIKEYEHEYDTVRPTIYSSEIGINSVDNETA